MKSRRSIFLLLAFACFATIALLLTRPSTAHAEELLVRGRTVVAWLNDVQIGVKPGATNFPEDVLVSAGTVVVPALCNVLAGSESMKDLSMRLPVVPPNTKNMHAVVSPALMLKAKAVDVLQLIAYQHPTAPEVLAAVPCLTHGLGSPSREVRCRSAQALGSIGPGATNSVPHLISSLRDDDSGVRMSAVEALGRIGLPTPPVIKAVTSACSDTNSDVSITARAVLKVLEPEK